ncbi:MAG TPA: CBS domain-containing protein [Stellaceae bacterium]|nr:CBS domain-containing protein [Stellaceae bacterium]
MQAADVMTRSVITTTAEASIEEVARLMVFHRFSGVPVVDAKGRVVGMITEGDLLRRSETDTEKPHSRWVRLLIGPGRLAQEYAQTHARKVEEVMSSPVVSVTPETSLAEVVALMESRGVKRLPVLENDRLVGLVSRADLLKGLAELLPKPRAKAISDAELRERILAEIAKQPWTPSASVDAVVAEGTVELRGVITDERERVALHVLAENVPGVKKVRDHLVWVDPISGAVIDTSSQES